MNLNQFAVESFPDWIGFALIVACALWLGWECLVSYCDRQPIQPAAPRYPVNEQVNVAEVMMHMGLRRPLPEVRKTEHRWPINEDHIDHLLRTAGCSDTERADIMRGTKL